MNRIRPFFLLLVLLAAALACRGTAETGRSLQSASRARPVPGVTVVPGEAPAPGAIAFLGNDNNIYTISPTGGNQNALTDDANVTPEESITYRHITWSPDGRQVAFVRFHVEDGERTGSLIASDPNSKDGRTIFDSEEIFPFYLFWSPDSSAVTFLSNDPDSNVIGLYLSELDDGEPAILDRGSPYYWTWAPDGSRLFVHTGARSGGRLAFLSPTVGAQPQELDLQPTTFQAPSWSSDGERLLLAVENDRGGDSLVLIDPQGDIVREVAELSAQAAFVLAPDGRHVAVTQGRTLFGAGTVGKLQVIDVENPGEPITTPEDLVLSFFWSPDGEKIVYFALDEVNRQRARLAQPVQNGNEVLLGVYVLDISSGSTIFLDAVVPTDAFVEVLPYFDQYHGSTTIWSPDSRHFVVTAMDEEDIPALWVYDADGSSLPRRLASGRVAFWSWR